MEAGDIIIMDKPKRKSPTPKKKDGEERVVIIYKLEIKGTNFLYVGHTENFKQRVDNHRTACKANLDPSALNAGKNSPVYVEINRNGGWTAVTMTPVEEFVSKSKVQSRIREQYWIDKIQVARRDAVMMNGCRAYVSPEYHQEHREANREANREKSAEYREANREKIAEYREANREKKAEYFADYYQEHREKLNAKCREHNLKKMTCGCGVEHSVGHKSHHLKTAKHIAWERDIDQKFNNRLEKEMNELIQNNVV